MGQLKKENQPWQDSNLQSPDPKSGALSIRPQGHTVEEKEGLLLRDGGKGKKGLVLWSTR